MDAVDFFKNFFEIIFGKEKIINFEDTLIVNESRFKKIEKFIFACVLEGIFLTIFSMIILFFINFEINKTIFISILIFFVPFLINFLWQDLFFEKRKRKKESLLPEFLLEVSVFCDENSIIKNVEKMSKIDISLIKNDFERVDREIKNGSSVKESFERMKKLNKSKTINRVIDIFLQCYENGLKMSFLLKETAEDLMENNAILKEQQAVMLVTKYTLLLSSALIVPSILGIIIGLVNNLNFDFAEGFEIGLSAVEKKELFSFSVLGTTIYIIEFALLSSFFLGLQEGNKKQFWIYAMIIVPIALICFFLAQTMG
ncbi:MAG: type II secretion system F family protein [Candidatus ainarchaeum sp.]|nr:type II secretion system F family protein [Candidatus ainarchaeum sp.]